MAKKPEKTVLFLCTGNYYRSRFSETLFNSVASKFGLPWKASSRGLALERGFANIGPMAASAVQHLQQAGIKATFDFARFPAQVTAAELDQADLIVALKQTEHLPLLEERYPHWFAKLEFWEVDDAPGVFGLMEREVMYLAARLLCGGLPRDPNSPDLAEESEPTPQPPISAATKSNTILRVGRETKGRRGKGVTTVTGVPLKGEQLEEFASKLKQQCGTGGTVKDEVIEIQGDQRDRLISLLEGQGFKVKRAGG